MGDMHRNPVGGEWRGGTHVCGATSKPEERCWPADYFTAKPA